MSKKNKAAQDSNSGAHKQTLKSIDKDLEHFKGQSGGLWRYATSIMKECIKVQQDPLCGDTSRMAKLFLIATKDNKTMASAIRNCAKVICNVNLSIDKDSGEVKHKKSTKPMDSDALAKSIAKLKELNEGADDALRIFTPKVKAKKRGAEGSEAPVGAIQLCAGAIDKAMTEIEKWNENDPELASIRQEMLELVQRAERRAKKLNPDFALSGMATDSLAAEQETPAQAA